MDADHCGVYGRKAEKPNTIAANGFEKVDPKDRRISSLVADVGHSTIIHHTKFITMARIHAFFILAALTFSSCDQASQSNGKIHRPPVTAQDTLAARGAYSDVNGIKIYYEVYGKGKPLVLIHGGGSTIASSFGRILPLLAGHYEVIAPALQNHGRSGFRNIPETFEQDAEDVLGLLKNMGIDKASFFGFSNGGTTALQIAIHHPEKVNKLVLASATYKRDGLPAGFFDGMKQATLEQMPPELKAAFLKVNPDTAKLRIMFEKDRDRMIAFKDIGDKQIKSITAPTLIINADNDVVRPEQAVRLFRLLPNARLAIIPGHHGEYMGEVTTLKSDSTEFRFVIPMIERFLDQPGKP